MSLGIRDGGGPHSSYAPFNFLSDIPLPVMIELDKTLILQLMHNTPCSDWLTVLTNQIALISMHKVYKQVHSMSQIIISQNVLTIILNRSVNPLRSFWVTKYRQ